MVHESACASRMFSNRTDTQLAVVNMAKETVTIEVVSILGEGKCSLGQRVGDVFRYPEDLNRLCPNAFHILYPWILVLKSGGAFPFFDNNGSSMTLGCSDYKHQVVFRITRKRL